MCGIFAIYGHDEAANIAYLGLHSLQHRGQESAGIVAACDGKLRRQVAMGLVSEAFDHDHLGRLPGRSAIGHVRYSTAGSSELRNAQPFLFDYAHGSVAIAHNGNLINADAIRTRFETEGSIFQTTSDTEVIVHLLARAREGSTEDRLVAALAQVTGAYSLIVLTERQLIAARDPHGVRPLCLGRLKDAYVLSSETSSFSLIEAEFIRELAPGELVTIDENGMHARPLRASASVSASVSVARALPRRAPTPTLEPAPPDAAALPNDAAPPNDDSGDADSAAPPARHFCVFEHIYFARPDSVLNGRAVYRCREQLGRRLAIEHPVAADVVIPVPDSGVAAAIGYARESGLTYEMGLIRSHYVGRTFIEPQDSIRHFGVRLKLSPVRAVVEGKRVVVVDDSIVRGTTSRKIVKMLRAAGAREIHLRIAAPPTTHSCFYGIDTPTRSELIASSHSVGEIARYVTCDSLGYLSHAGMMRAISLVADTDAPAPERPAPTEGSGCHRDPPGHCSACFTGSYPIPLVSERPATAEIGPGRVLPEVVPDVVTDVVPDAAAANPRAANPLRGS